MSEEHLYPIPLEKGRGFINERGETVIDPVFVDAGDFVDGRARVRLKSEKRRFIDTQGVWIGDDEYDDARNFSEGLAAVRIEDRWGFIDLSGTFVIPPTFLVAESFTDGLAKVELRRRRNEVVFINRSGQTAFRLACRFASSFSEGMAVFEVLDSMSEGEFVEPTLAGFIDKTGHAVIKPKYIHAGIFSEGLADVLPTREEPIRRLVIDKQEQVVIGPRFEGIGAFSEGYAFFTLNKKAGFINRAGEVVVDPVYDLARGFRDGMATVAVRQGRQWRFGFFNRNCELAIPLSYDRAWDFRNGLALVDKGGKLMYINKDNEPIWRED